MELKSRVQILDKAAYILPHSNHLQNGMNPIIQP